MGEVSARIERRVRELIGSGDLPADGRLPSERKLADELGAGRTTVRLVLAKLAAEGVIRAEHGRAYFAVLPEHPAVPDTATDQELQPWRVYGERTIYNNRWVRLTLMDVEPPGTERFEHHVVRLHHVAVAAVLDDQERVLMLWRYRFVPERWGWELPGGIVDAGEDSTTAAEREVEEETGWRPTSSLKSVVKFEPMVGMVDSPHEILIGRGAEFVSPPTDIEEGGRVAWIPLAEVPGMIERDELLGSGTLVALLYLLAHRSRTDATSSQ